MSQRPNPTASAGWYEDPERPTEFRYWDGSQWTERVAATTSIGERSHVASLGNPSTRVATSGWAVAALVVALAGGFFAPVAIWLGAKGRREIDQSGGLRTGRGMATAGMWIGVVELVIFVAVIVFVLLPLQQ
jgi:hypothetical protein